MATRRWLGRNCVGHVYRVEKAVLEEDRKEPCDSFYHIDRDPQSKFSLVRDLSVEDLGADDLFAEAGPPNRCVYRALRSCFLASPVSFLELHFGHGPAIFIS